jgi:hypothetical protein
MVVPSKKKPAVLNIFLKGKCRVVPKLVPGWYPGLQTLKMHFRSLNLSWGVIEVQSSQNVTFTSLNFSSHVIQARRGSNPLCALMWQAAVHPWWLRS